MKSETAKKALAFAVCVLFIAATLLSVTFVLAHTHHEHNHNGPGGTCAACVHLAIAGNLLKFFAVAVVCAAFGFGGFFAVRSAQIAVDFHTASFTLVRQKIKLNI